MVEHGARTESESSRLPSPGELRPTFAAPAPWPLACVGVEPGCGWAASPSRLAVAANAHLLTCDRLRLPVHSPAPAMLGCAGLDVSRAL